MNCVRILLAAGVLTAFASPVVAQGHDHSAGSANGVSLGELTFPNSGNPAAQETFLRGVKQLHNFQYDEAIAAFQLAQKADPDFVLAYWGEAMAHNYTLWAEQHYDQAKAALARLAPTPEARAAKAKTDRERMWLAAVETLYGSGTKFERDLAYADRMDVLAKAYPDDVEAKVFGALATLGRSHGNRDAGGYMAAAAALEELFPARQSHPGIIHYLIHAYDDPVHAPLGLRAARLYNKVASGSVHAQHMTSHIYLARGMWPETEKANVDAINLANREAFARGDPPYACGHELNWLVYAKLQQGKDTAPEASACRAEAERRLREPGELPVVGYPGGLTASWADMAVRSGIEAGKWPASWIDLPAGKQTYARFTQDYGRVLAARHDPTGAQAALGALKADQEILVANFRKEFPDDDTNLPWVERAVAQGEAVALLAQGKSEEGLELLRKAAEAEAALPPPFGPPALQKPSAEMLGDELLALGRKVEAAEAYRRALVAAPGRRLSLRGIAAATAGSTLASKEGKH